MCGFNLFLLGFGQELHLRLRVFDRLQVRVQADGHGGHCRRYQAPGCSGLDQLQRFLGGCGSHDRALQSLLGDFCGDRCHLVAHQRGRDSHQRGLNNRAISLHPAGDRFQPGQELGADILRDVLHGFGHAVQHLSAEVLHLSHYRRHGLADLSHGLIPALVRLVCFNDLLVSFPVFPRGVTVQAGQGFGDQRLAFLLGGAVLQGDVKSILSADSFLDSRIILVDSLLLLLAGLILSLLRVGHFLQLFG